MNEIKLEISGAETALSPVAPFNLSTEMEEHPRGNLSLIINGLGAGNQSVELREGGVGFSYDYYDDAGAAGNFTGSGGMPCPGSNGATLEQLMIVNDLGTVFGLVLQNVFAISGILANAVAISILMTSKKLESIFNFILICNLMLHSLYLASSIATEIYKVFGQTSYTAHVIFASFLLAFKPMLLHASTFLTVMMARERYLAISNPTEYRNATLLQLVDSHIWKRPLLYMCMSVAASTLFVLPLNWEGKVAGRNVTRTDDFGNVVEVSEYYLAVSDFYLNPDYILWYKNLASFVVTLLLPLILLAFYNCSTYKRINQRKLCRRGSHHHRTANGPGSSGGEEETAMTPTATAGASTNTLGSKTAAGGNNQIVTKTLLRLFKKEEEKKARILFVIIINFLLCNTLRFILNVEECFSGRDYGFSREHNCSLLPFWFLVTNHCSHLLICINASLGFVVYCAMSKEFRAELGARWLVAKKCCRRN